MDFFALLQQGGAASLLGWVLIAGGLALAVHTLAAAAGPSPPVVDLARVPRPADREVRALAPAATPRFDAAWHWQRLVDIADLRLAQAETIAELHARAAAELHAAEQALRQLLDEWGLEPAAELQSEPLGPLTPSPRPLAA
ncbi:MAG TPA: hypothetical protein VFA64_06440 [Hyphomicrobiaceae bacterium]|nr:hypothetical protein [Hyphomicrobiaceae bacterium]